MLQVLGWKSREPVQEKTRYFQACVRCCQQVDPSAEQLIDLETEARSKIVNFGTASVQEKEECVEWLRLLLDDPEKSSKLSDRLKLSSLIQISAVLIGFAPGKLALEPSIENFRRGGEYHTLSCVMRSKIADSQTGWHRSHNRGFSFHPFSCCVASYLSHKQRAAALQILGVEGAKLLEWHDAYMYSFSGVLFVSVKFIYLFFFAWPHSVSREISSSESRRVFRYVAFPPCESADNCTV